MDRNGRLADDHSRAKGHERIQSSLDQVLPTTSHVHGADALHPRGRACFSSTPWFLFSRVSCLHDMWLNPEGGEEKRARCRRQRRVPIPGQTERRRRGRAGAGWLLLSPRAIFHEGEVEISLSDVSLRARFCLALDLLYRSPSKAGQAPDQAMLGMLPIIWPKGGVGDEGRPARVRHGLWNQKTPSRTPLPMLSLLQGRMSALTSPPLPMLPQSAQVFCDQVC